MNSQNFNDILKKRASEFILPPYDNALSNVIEARRKKRQRKARWLIALIGLTSCLLLSAIVFFYQDNKSGISSQLTSENKMQKIDDISLRYQAKTENGNESLKDNIGVISNEELNSKSRISNETRQSSVKPFVKIKPQVSIARNDKEKEKMNLLPLQKIANSQVENQIEITSNLNKEKSTSIDGAKNDLNNEVGAVEIKSLTPDTIQPIYSRPTYLNLLANIDSLNNNVTASKNVKNTKYGFQISLFNHYMLLNKAYNGAENELIENDFGINYKEQAKQSYSIGILAGISMNKFSFTMGLAYNQVEFNKLLLIENPSKNVSPPGIKDIFLNASGYKVNVIDQSMSFMEMPFLIGYRIGAKKLTFNVETGLFTQYLSQTNTYLLVMNNNRLETSTNDDAASNRFERWQFGFVSSVNMQYNLTKNLSVFLGPIAKIHLYQYYKKEFTERNPPVYLGVNSGIKFIF